MSREYEVKIDVFFMDSIMVEADSVEDAKQKAIDQACYGYGEEITVFEVQEQS